MTQDREYFTLKEAAEWLGVSRGLLRKRIKEGKLPALKLGDLVMLRREDLEKQLKEVVK